MPAPVRDRVRGWLRATPAGRIYTLTSDELDLIETEIRSLGPDPWQRSQSDMSTAGMDERVVEIPWVLSRYRGEGRVLDVGTAWALPVYSKKLVSLGIPQLDGVDLLARPVAGVRMTQADVRRLPYSDATFDLILCISTLEHIGLDNTHFTASAVQQVDGDVAAMREFSRVLAPRGRLLLTVPFGRPERHRWLKQYDELEWERLVRNTDLHVAEVAYYRYGDVRGWRQVQPPNFPNRGFQEKGAPAATGVLCAELQHSRP